MYIGLLLPTRARITQVRSLIVNSVQISVRLPHAADESNCQCAWCVREQLIPQYHSTHFTVDLLISGRSTRPNNAA